jgi:hypothetical protein
MSYHVTYFLRLLRTNVRFLRLNEVQLITILQSESLWLHFKN